MATILEGALWTLTEAAAERMVENGILVRCEDEHSCAPTDGLEVDKPYYHISQETSASWVGMSTLPAAIAAAEKHVEEAKDAQRPVVS